MNDLGVGRNRPAESHPEVEQRAREDHQVGLTERLASGPVEELRVVPWHLTAPHPVHKARHGRRLEKLDQRGAALSPLERRSRHHQSTFSRDYEADSLIDESIGGTSRDSIVAESGKGDLVEVDGAMQNVDRYLQKGRSGHSGQSISDSQLDGLTDSLRLQARISPFGDGPHQRDVIHLL